MKIEITPEELSKMITNPSEREQKLSDALAATENCRSELASKLKVLHTDNEQLGKNNGELASKICDLNHIQSTNAHYIEILIKDWNTRKGNRKLVFRNGLVMEA